VPGQHSFDFRAARMSFLTYLWVTSSWVIAFSARQSLQAAYISHLRRQVAPRRRAEKPATVELSVPESLVGHLS
jgi:hypothetical protein